MRPRFRLVSPSRNGIRPLSLSSLGCDISAMGAPVEDFPITIAGTTVPASQVFNDDFLNARTATSVQALASGLLSGSAGVAPVLNDDGSVSVKGILVVPPGGAKLDALQAVLLSAGKVPASIPVNQTPATILTQKPASWWTNVARANTTDAALVRLENDLRNNLVAVTQTGAVVGGGLTPSSGATRVYVTLQPAGAVDVPAFQATGGRVFAQTAPSVLTPVAGGALPTLSAGTSAPVNTNFFSNLIDNTLKTAASLGQSSLLSSLLPPPPIAPPVPSGVPGAPAIPPAPGGVPSNNLGLGFSLPPPPLAPVAPVAPALNYGNTVPPLVATPTVPTSGNIATPPSLPSILSTAPTPPALPVFPGIPATGATGDGLGLSGSGFITGLPTAPTPPAAPVAGTPWGKIGLIAGGLAAVGLLAWSLSRRGGPPRTRTVYRSRPVYRRRRYA